MKRICERETKTYTRIPVTTEAIKVPRIAKVTMAPKLEKKGFCKGGGNNSKEEMGCKAIGKQAFISELQRNIQRQNTEKLTGERLKPD